VVVAERSGNARQADEPRYRSTVKPRRSLPWW